MAAPGRRIAVVGTTGTGKTTFAARLARRHGCPHIELDALHWEAGWTPADREALRTRVDAATRAAAWVTDGNYSSVRDLVWPRADTLIWLDYPLLFTLVRLIARTLRRAISRQELWNGNRESMRSAFLSRDSILLWALRTHGKLRRGYPRLLGLPEHRHLEVHRFRTARAAERWMHAQEEAPLP